MPQGQKHVTTNAKCFNDFNIVDLEHKYTQLVLVIGEALKYAPLVQTYVPLVQKHAPLVQNYVPLVQTCL